MISGLEVIGEWMAPNRSLAEESLKDDRSYRTSLDAGFLPLPNVHPLHPYGVKETTAPQCRGTLRISRFSYAK